MGERPTLLARVDISYDDSEFPECRGWRAEFGNLQLGGTSTYGPGFPTMSAAVAAVEKWAADRHIDLTETILVIDGRPAREAPSE